MAPKDSGKSSQRRASPTSRGGKKSETRQPEHKKARSASKAISAVEPIASETANLPPVAAEGSKRKRGKAGSDADAAPQSGQITSADSKDEDARSSVTLNLSEQSVGSPLDTDEESHELDAAADTPHDLDETELEAQEPRIAATTTPTSRGERRAAHANALGLFIERQFAKKESPCHSYSDLERHSNISREALSRYVTSRADRRRAPTIDTMVAIADALRVSLEGVARAAAASVTGIVPPPEDVQKAREEALGALVAPLSDAQFNAVAELLRQMRPEREK